VGIGVTAHRMLYFAYGSNMDPRQFRRRCPRARFVTIARAEGYRLDFTLRSKRRRCGVANIVPNDMDETKNDDVWGIVYRMLHPRDIATLDAAEGFRGPDQRVNRYDRGPLTVLTPEGATCFTDTYFGVIESAPPPSRAYLGQMIFGAEYWGLPEDYRIKLRQIHNSLAPGR
jgi:hypothetical protein